MFMIITIHIAELANKLALARETVSTQSVASQTMIASIVTREFGPQNPSPQRDDGLASKPAPNKPRKTLSQTQNWLNTGTCPQ